MDRFRIKMYRGQLVEENHYYPYELVINSISMNPLERRYLYQGKEQMHDHALMWYDFHARQYDPQLGRFASLDPEHQFFSGYLDMGNNPALHTDPDGKVVPAVIIAIGTGALIGGAIDGATYLASALVLGNGKDINWSDFGSAVGMGAVGGAMSAGVGALTTIGHQAGNSIVMSMAQNFAASVATDIALQREPSVGNYIGYAAMGAVNGLVPLIQGVQVQQRRGEAVFR